MLFISYSSMDWEAAEAVCATLELRGLQCWMAPRDILPGDDWGSAVLNGIEAADALVLIFSAPANQSSQVKREVSHALRRGFAVFPIRLDDTTPAASFRLLDAEFAAAADATLALDARIAVLTEAVSRMAGGTLPSSQIERHDPRLVTGDWPPRVASHLLGTAVKAALVVTSLRTLLIVAAITEYWSGDLDIDAARTFLVLSLPLHAASVCFLLAVFTVWMSLACSRFLDIRTEDVVRAFLRPPRNLTAPDRLMRALTEAVAFDRPAWMARVWWPLGCAVIVLTLVVPVVAAIDDADPLLLLSIDGAMTALWLVMALLTVAIARSVDRVPITEGVRRAAARVP